MLNRIIFWSIHNKLIVAVLTLALIVWGLFSLSKLPIDAVPDITNNQVQVVTTAASSSALDIERFVTFPVEQTMATIPGIEEIRSFSRFGLSVVTIVFTEDTDIYWARQQVQERLSEAKNNIPAGFGEPSMAPLSTGLGEIYQYTIRAKKGYAKRYSPADLRSPQRIVACPCGSPSTSSTFAPRAANPIAIWTASVVFPTPPFSFNNVITFTIFKPHH